MITANIDTDEMALSSATGISGGAALTIPTLFLSALSQKSAPFSRLKDPKLERIEKIDEEDCYVISGPSSISKKETLWISKKSYLIRKYCRSLEPPEGGSTIPEMTDEQLEQAIKAMGQEVTEKSKKNMRDMMEKSRKMLKTIKLKGSSSELHKKVSSPALNKNDFKFILPEGTTLKKSLFGAMLSGDKGIAINPAIKKDQKKTDKRKFKRRIYMKLPLQQPRFHWVFTEKDKYLNGELILTITSNGNKEKFTIFKDGVLSDDWEPMDNHKYRGNDIYFGFESKNKHLVSETDKVDLILKLKSDIKGKGANMKGILKSGVYKSSNQFKLYHLEGFTGKEDVYAFLNNDTWDSRWSLKKTSNKGWMNKSSSPATLER